MALVNKTQFKVAITDASIGLTSAWEDSVQANQMASEILDPRHPLRRVEKLITMADDGIFTPNTDFIDAAYLGKNPSVGSTLDKVVESSSNPPLPSSVRRQMVYFTNLAPSLNQGEASWSSDSLIPPMFPFLGCQQLSLLGADESAFFDQLNIDTTCLIYQESNPSNFASITLFNYMFDNPTPLTGLITSDLGGNIIEWSVEVPAEGQIIVIERNV